MRPVHFLTVLCCLGLSFSAARADDPTSGPQVGEAVEGFEFEAATGEDAGKKLDPLKPLKDKPVLIIFEGQMTRPGFGLLKVLDKYGRLRQPEGLEVLIVRLSDDAAAAARHAKLLYDMYDVKSPAGVATEGKAGPKDYNLSDEAEMTVLLVNKERKVVYNMARRAPERQDFGEVRKAIDKLLGPSPVPFP
ncbi:MAG: hypothetical protein ACM3U2_21975 [Deltaproteobacteria bacterium]